METVKLSNNCLQNFPKEQNQGQVDCKRWGYDEELDIEALLSRPRPERRKKTVSKRPRAPEFLKRLDAFIEVDFGDDVVFDCKVVSVSKTKIAWYHDEQDITDNPRYRVTEHGDGVYSLVIPDATKFDEGPYKVRATNFEGSSASTGYLEVSGDISVTPLSRQPRRNSEHAISQPPPLPGITEQISLEDLRALDYARDTPVWMRKSYGNRQDSLTEDDYSDTESDTSVESQSEDLLSSIDNKLLCSENEISNNHRWFNSPIKETNECKTDNLDSEISSNDNSSRTRILPLQTHTSCEFENVQNMLHEAIADISQQEACIEKDKYNITESNEGLLISHDSGSIPDLLEGISENRKLSVDNSSFSDLINTNSILEGQEIFRESDKVTDRNDDKNVYDDINKSTNVPIETAEHSDCQIQFKGKKNSQDTLTYLVQGFSKLLNFLDRVDFPLLYYIFFVIICSFMGTWKEISPPIYTLMISVFSISSFIYSSIYTNYNTRFKKKKKHKIV